MLRKQRTDIIKEIFENFKRILEKGILKINEIGEVLNISKYANTRQRAMIYSGQGFETEIS